MNNPAHVRTTTTVNHIDVGLAEKTKREIDETVEKFREAQQREDERIANQRAANSKPHFKWWGLRP